MLSRDGSSNRDMPGALRREVEQCVGGTDREVEIVLGTARARIVHSAIEPVG